MPADELFAGATVDIDHLAIQQPSTGGGDEAKEYDELALVGQSLGA